MLKNAVALVTGGASGLGKATAERLIEKQLRVIIADLRTSDGKSVARKLGSDCSFLPLDVTKEDNVKETFESIKSKHGRLDILVNCAGTARAFPIFNFTKMKPCLLEDFQDCLETNTIGTFSMIREAAGLMGENEPNEDGQRGVIVNTAGTSAFDGDFAQLPTAASYGGIVGMGLPLARDFSEAGIRVVTIAPGIFHTPMVDFMPEDVLTYCGSRQAFPNRIGRPAEFAHLVDAVIDNPMLNGCTIRLDGGIRRVM